MDLGFLDLGCVSVSDKQGATQGSPDSDSKIGKEEDDMNLTVDETLGDCNPHYSKVLSERVAATEAAQKTMQAQKAASVEASWCRILLAARIKSKEAEAELLKADKAAAEAFEVASSLGVILYDIPNCSRKPFVETSTINGGRSTSHSVTTSIETAFEVDKEVAAAVEVALLRLGNIHSFSNEDLNDQLPKFNENPNKDTGENNQELPELSSECESESGSEQQKSRWQSFGKLKKESIVEMVLERLQCLKEEELSSLVSIVATCGLNAALTENSKLLGPGSATETFLQRLSNLGAGKPKYFRDGQRRTKKIKSKFPSLDKLLVKNMAKLEKEVQAKKRRNESKEETLEISDRIVDEKAGSDDSKITSETILGLQSILWKHDSKLENDIEEAKENSRGDFKILTDLSHRFKLWKVQEENSSGTTTIAIVGSKGIYLAADGRITGKKGLISSGNDVKLVKISDCLIATLAGITVQGNALVDFLKPRFINSDSIQAVCDACNTYISDWNKAYPRFKFEATVNIYGYIGDIAHVYSTDTCWIAKLAVGRISGSGSGYGFAKKYILAKKLNRLHREPTDIEFFEIVKGAVAASSLEDAFVGGIVNSAAVWKIGMAQFNSRTEHVSKILIRQHMAFNRYLDKCLFIRTVGLPYIYENEWALKAFVRKQLNFCSKMHVFCVEHPRPGGVPLVITTRIMQMKQAHDIQQVEDLKDNLQNGPYKDIKLSRPTKKVIKEISRNLIPSDY